MPELFGLSTITYWQALGLCLLSKILFGGFGCGGKGGHKSHHKMHKDNDQCDDNEKNDMSKWKFYDKFWEEEGNQAFEEYIAHKKVKSKGQEEE